MFRLVRVVTFTFTSQAWVSPTKKTPKSNTYHVKVRAYKEGSYRAVARVEEGSDSSGRERALW